MRAVLKTLRHSITAQRCHRGRGSLAPVVAIIAVILAIGTVATLFAPIARADTAQYGPGFHYGNRGTDGFLGAYRIEGANAYCLDYLSPPANARSYRSHTTVFGTGDLDGHGDARLATLLRLYGNAGDDVTAAAVNLNVWTWLRDAPRSASWYAARAGSRAQDVLAAAAAQRSEVDAQTVLDTTARTSVVLADDSATGTVTTDLRVVRLNGEGDAPAGTHPVRVTISGATFAHGATEAVVMNGLPAHIVPDRTTAIVRVAVDAFVESLSHPRAVSLFAADNPGGQRLVRSSDSPIVSRASATTAPRPSPLPWQPTVVTTSSTSRDAQPGTVVSDTIEVGSAPAQSGTLGGWGVDENLAAQSIEVVSELLGPFLGAELAVASEWPREAPRVCRVTTVVSAPGRYSTDPCTIPAPGRYAWVESIEASDRRLPWRSQFGIPSEVLIAEWAPTITTEATEISVRDDGACVADRLHVTKVNPSARSGLIVTVDLLGPFPQKPAAEASDPGQVTARAVASTDVPVFADGTFVTPCLDLPRDQFGYYYFVWHHGGSTPDQDGYQIIPPAADLRPHESETVLFARAEPALPETGNNRLDAITSAWTATGIGLASLGFAWVMRRRRR